MRTAALAALALLWGLAAQAATNADLQKSIIDETAAALFGSREEYFLLPRPPMPFNARLTVSTCSEYLAAKKVSNPANNSLRNNFTCEYLMCDLLHTLESGVPVNGPPPYDLTGELIERLDLKSFGNILAKRLTPGGRTLKDMRIPREIEETANSLSILGETAEITLKVVAVADFNGNGRADWLLTEQETSAEEGIRSCSLIAIYDVENGGLLEGRALAGPTEYLRRPK